MNDSVEKRMKDAMSIAGPSILMTSYTDAVAFFVGATTKIIALRSFCMYAGFSILGLYGAVLTLFACIVVWDTRRQVRKRRECCGLCCCAEDSFCFCYGNLLSKAQRQFSGLDKPTISEKNT